MATTATPYKLDEGAPHYVEEGGVPASPYNNYSAQAPRIHQSQKSGGGGGFCLGCSLTFLILCCVLPAIAILAAYFFVRKKMNDVQGGDWSQYLNDMDDATISNYIDQYTNGDDDTIAGYIDQFTNGDDDTISSYISNWGGGDGGD